MYGKKMYAPSGLREMREVGKNRVWNGRPGKKDPLTSTAERVKVAKS
jgi:hypothetical protein